VVGTDAGHSGRSLDSSWAVGHPEKVIDNGFRAIHEVTAPRSESSRLSMGASPPIRISAVVRRWNARPDGSQRYPTTTTESSLAHQPSRMCLSTMAWQHSLVGDGQAIFLQAQLAAIQAAALAACDRIDGIVDELSGPQRCTFDPGTLACNGAKPTLPSPRPTYDIAETLCRGCPR